MAGAGLHRDRRDLARERSRGEPRSRTGVPPRRSADTSRDLSREAERLHHVGNGRLRRWRWSAAEAVHTRGTAATTRAAQRVQGLQQQEVLQTRDDGDVQGPEGLRLHRLPEKLRRGLLQGPLPAAVQPGASSRAVAEPAVEGGSQESAEAVLRAQQAQPADGRLLRREEAFGAAGILLAQHYSGGVRVLLRAAEETDGGKGEEKSETVYHRRGLTKESSELWFGAAACVRGRAGATSLVQKPRVSLEFVESVEISNVTRK